MLLSRLARLNELVRPYEADARAGRVRFWVADAQVAGLTARLDECKRHNLVTGYKVHRRGERTEVEAELLQPYS